MRTFNINPVLLSTSYIGISSFVQLQLLLPCLGSSPASCVAFGYHVSFSILLEQFLVFPGLSGPRKCRPVLLTVFPPECICCTCTVTLRLGFFGENGVEVRVRPPQGTHWGGTRCRSVVGGMLPSLTWEGSVLQVSPLGSY